MSIRVPMALAVLLLVGAVQQNAQAAPQKESWWQEVWLEEQFGEVGRPYGPQGHDHRETQEEKQENEKKGSAGDAGDIDVSSLKMISTSCP